MPVGIVDTMGGDLPLPVGGGAAVGVPPSDVDVLVDRVPFWLAIDADNPYLRETAQWQREQVDQQPEAGEQSLAGWWTRSQMSFHYGAGLDYLDTLARPQPEDRLRYKTSRNIDPWTPGKLKRLNGTTLAAETGAGEPVWVDVFGGDLIVGFTASTSEVWDGASWDEDTNATTATATCSDGTNLYVALSTGAIWKVAGGNPITGTWSELYTASAGAVPMHLGWVKQRLIFGRGANLYELDPAATSDPLPTAKMTHPNASWQWTSFSDGPGGILACGYAGQSSCVYSFALADVSGTPTLGAGIVIITLPVGERVLSSLFYVGSLLILGTTHGVRVCPFDTFYGTANLGPLSVESEASVTALGGFDRYVWGGTQVGGETSLIRLDLSAPLDQAGHYAWAPDLVFPDGDWTEEVTSIAFTSTGRKVVGVESRGVVTEDESTNPADAAWLETARIRMGTAEHKNWAYALLRGTYGDDAPIGVSLSTPAEPDFETVFVTTNNEERFAIHRNPSEWLVLRFDLSEGAEISSYQVQALPAGNRQRLISLPVWVHDFQTTRSGVVVGYPGWARDRIAEIEALENAGAEITVAAPALFPEAVLGVVERLAYQQPDDPGDRGDGTGGRLQIVLRTTT